MCVWCVRFTIDDSYKLLYFIVWQVLTEPSVWGSSAAGGNDCTLRFVYNNVMYTVQCCTFASVFDQFVHNVCELFVCAIGTRSCFAHMYRMKRTIDTYRIHNKIVCKERQRTHMFIYRLDATLNTVQGITYFFMSKEYLTDDQNDLKFYANYNIISGL